MKEFDPSHIDSGVFTLTAPEFLAHRLHSLLVSEKNNYESILGDYNRDTFEETRLRLLADAVIASHLISQDTSPHWRGLLRETLEGVKGLPAVSHCEKWPVPFMAIDGVVTVLLPRPTVNCTSEEQLEALNEIYEAQDSPEHWVIDLSEHETLSDSLLGYLIGFQREQELRGKKILLLWVRNNAIPPHFENVLVKRFKLFRRGQFLMSRQE